MLQLTAVRRQRNISMSELARRAGMGLPELSRIESGKLYPYPGWRRRIAEALGTEDPDSLFEEVED